MKRIDEEKKDLTDRQIMRITYATTEFHIINSTYFYYVGLKNQSIEALKKIDPFGLFKKIQPNYYHISIILERRNYNKRY